MIQPAPAAGAAAQPVWPALLNGIVGAAVFAGVLVFIATSIDGAMARIAKGIDPAAAHVLLVFSELGSSDWMLIAAALVSVAAFVRASLCVRPRNRAGFAVMGTRAAYLFLVVALSVAVVQLIKFALGRAQPHLMSEMGVFHFQMFSANAVAASFPSGHATVSFAAAAVMAIFVPRWQAVFFLLALAVSIARVASGLHFPSDVLGGMVLGMTLAFALARYCARRKLVFHLVDGKLVRRGENLVRRALRAAVTRRAGDAPL